MTSTHKVLTATFGTILALTGVLYGCRNKPAPAPYQPGLGEIMTLTQMRHAKLWLAGDAQNWALASYEVGEIAEGFQEVIAYHPAYKDSPVPLADAIPLMIDAPIAELRAAIAKQDPATFAAAYDDLTAACNACHEATNYGFNVVQRPAANSFPNQVFVVPR